MEAESITFLFIYFFNDEEPHLFFLMTRNLTEVNPSDFTTKAPTHLTFRPCSLLTRLVPNNIQVISPKFCTNTPFNSVKSRTKR